MCEYFLDPAVISYIHFQVCGRFPEILTVLKWTHKNLELRRHRMWSLNRQLQCKSVKIYRAQTPQNLALTKILHKLRKTSTLQL